jgi:hypothetical protein
MNPAPNDGDSHRLNSRADRGITFLSGAALGLAARMFKTDVVTHRTFARS